MPPKRKKSENASEPAKELKTPEDIKTYILSLMLQYHMDDKNDASFGDDVAKEAGVHKSNNKWSKLWTSLKTEGLIAPSTSGKGCQITAEGIAKCKSPEYEAFMKDKNFVATTNDEHQDRIKSRFKKKKSVEIFDLFMKYGSLSRYETAGLVGQKDRSHAFSYSFAELKGKGLTELDPQNNGKPQKFRLSDKAFLKPGDRPDPEPIDPKTLAEAVAWNANTKPKKDKNADEDDDETGAKAAKKQKRGKKAKVAEEPTDDDGDDEDMPTEENSADVDNEGELEKECKKTSSVKAKTEITKAEAFGSGVKGEEEIAKGAEQEDQNVKSEDMKTEATDNGFKGENTTGGKPFLLD